MALFNVYPQFQTAGVVTDDTSTSATMYPIFATTTTGGLIPKVSSSKLTYNPSTGVLSSTTISATTISGTTISGTTQSANDNSTKVATTAYVDRIALPIGTIIAFDANRTAGLSGGGTGGWTDNVTLVGWYACIAGNSVWGCPDLSGNSYLSGKVVAGSGTTFGTNSYSLSVAQLASHNHTGTTDSTDINHNHGGTVDSTDINHTHNGTTNSGTVPIQISNGFGGGGYNADYISSGQNYYGGHGHTGHSHTFTSDNQNVGHTHLVTLTAQGSGTAIDSRPASYSIIWIRKCS